MRAPRRSAGFTLIEVAVTVAILALVAAVVVPTLAGYSRAELRRGAAELAGAIRSTYDEAALTGSTYRMVFPLGKKESAPRVRLEKTADAFAFDPQALGREAEADEPGAPSVIKLLGMDIPIDVAALGSDDEEGSPNPLAALLTSPGGASGSAVGSFAAAGEASALPDGVHILDVWVEGMDAPETEGESYLYFFPSGYTQRALVHLRDEEDRVFTLVVQPLTGSVRLEDHYVEAKE